MMYRYFSNGNYGREGCLRFFNNGWGILIAFGVIITISLLFYFVVHNSKRKTSYDAASENLKMKYVQGDITEEEYLKRKDVINRK